MEAWAKVIIIFMTGLFLMSIVPYFPIQNDMTVPIIVSLVLLSGVGGVYVAINN